MARGPAGPEPTVRYLKQDPGMDPGGLNLIQPKLVIILGPLLNHISIRGVVKRSLHTSSRDLHKRLVCILSSCVYLVCISRIFCVYM